MLYDTTVEVSQRPKLLINQTQLTQFKPVVGSILYSNYIFRLRFGLAFTLNLIYLLGPFVAICLLQQNGTFQDLGPFCVSLFQTKTVDIPPNIARTDLYQPPK